MFFLLQILQYICHDVPGSQCLWEMSCITGPIRSNSSKFQMLLISQLSGVFLLLNWFPWELELLMRLSLSSQMDMCIKILQDQNASKIGVYQNPKMDVYQNAPKMDMCIKIFQNRCVSKCFQNRCISKSQNGCVSKYLKKGVYQNSKMDQNWSLT